MIAHQGDMETGFNFDQKPLFIKDLALKFKELRDQGKI
jgi:hypothetical protein